MSEKKKNETSEKLSAEEIMKRTLLLAPMLIDKQMIQNVRAGIPGADGSGPIYGVVRFYDIDRDKREVIFLRVGKTELPPECRLQSITMSVEASCEVRSRGATLAKIEPSHTLVDAEQGISVPYGELVVEIVAVQGPTMPIVKLRSIEFLCMVCGKKDEGREVTCKSDRDEYVSVPIGWLISAARESWSRAYPVCWTRPATAADGTKRCR